MFDLPVAGFYLLNLFKSNYPEKSITPFSTKGFKEIVSI